jgi:hypothetical protein
MVAGSSATTKSGDLLPAEAPQPALNSQLKQMIRYGIDIHFP